jgi:hypothetical protein
VALAIVWAVAVLASIISRDFIFVLNFKAAASCLDYSS